MTSIVLSEGAEPLSLELGSSLILGKKLLMVTPLSFMEIVTSFMVLNWIYGHCSMELTSWILSCGSDMQHSANFVIPNDYHEPKGYQHLVPIERLHWLWKFWEARVVAMGGYALIWKTGILALTCLSMWTIFWLVCKNSFCTKDCLLYWGLIFDATCSWCTDSMEFNLYFGCCFDQVGN